MKKILLVSGHGLGRAGVPTVIMNIVRQLHGEYHFDILLFTDEVRYYDKEFESYGGTILRIPSPKKGVYSKIYKYVKGHRLYKETLRLIKENGGYDVIHCNNEIDAAFCLKAAYKAGIPIRIAHTHVIQTKAHPLWNYMLSHCIKLTNKYATHKIGCSEESCRRNFGGDSGWKVVNNPYDSKVFVFSEKGRGKEPVLTQIASYSENKNQMFTIDIVAELKKSYPNVKMNFIGFDLGGVLARLKEKIKMLGIEENVVFYPSDANSFEILSETDYLIFPSKKEGFGVVAIEAQAVGVSVFASDAVPRSTNCGGVAYLPLCMGAELWAEKIIADFKKTGGEHKNYNCSPFDAKNIAEEYRKIYNE